MSTTENTAQDATGADLTASQAEQALGDQTAENGPENGSEEPEAKTYDEAYVKRLRDEAASWRTKLRETQEQLAKSKTPEDYQALEERLAAVQAEHERQQVIARATKDLPEDLVAGLTWPSEEAAIKAMAASLVKHVAVQSADTGRLRGGLDPNTTSRGELDPGKLASRFNKRVRP